MRRPAPYLLALAIALGLLVFDTFRAPSDQVGSRVYAAGVHVYRQVGHRLLEGRIRCRYEPTCSEFSLEAVRVHGLRKGLALTLRRIHSCKVDVPLGTYDPVPRGDEEAGGQPSQQSSRLPGGSGGARPLA